MGWQYPYHTYSSFSRSKGDGSSLSVLYLPVRSLGLTKMDQHYLYCWLYCWYPRWGQVPDYQWSWKRNLYKRLVEETLLTYSAHLELTGIHRIFPTESILNRLKSLISQQDYNYIMFLCSMCISTSFSTYH